MKKNIFISVSILGILVSCIALPLNTSAKTIKEFEAEVSKYTKDLENKKSKVAKNDKEVAEIKKKISNIESQIKSAETEISQLEEEIKKSNEEIEAKTKESKKIMEYYQISNGENAYLEYAFGATSITDMIYRLSVVEQLTDYNKQVMDELERLIAENDKKKETLAVKNNELKKLKEDLNSEKEKINADTASLKAAMPGLEEQIKSAKANLNYYKNLGCGSNEDIQRCQYRVEQSRGSSGGGGGGSIPSANGFYRPMEYGYITQGYRGMSHMGMDLSSSNKTIPIYPIASGQVFAKYYDSYGALVVKIRHNTNGRYIYSTYAHLSSFGNISTNQYISYTTSLGNMGSSGYSTGPHLHLEVTTCDWHQGGGCTWYQYQRSTLNPANYVSFPSSWSNR